MTKKLPSKPKKKAALVQFHEVQLLLRDQWAHRVSDQLATQFTRLEEIRMALLDLKAALAKIDAATDNIAADIQTLKAAIKPGMSDAEVAEVQAGLDAAASKLEGIAASTDDVVPA